MDKSVQISEMMAEALDEANATLQNAFAPLSRASNLLDAKKTDAIEALLANIETDITPPITGQVRDALAGHILTLRRYHRELRIEETDPRALRKALTDIVSTLVEVEADAEMCGFVKTSLDTDGPEGVEIDPIDYAEEIKDIKEQVAQNKIDIAAIDRALDESGLPEVVKEAPKFEITKLTTNLKGLSFGLELEFEGKIDVTALVLAFSALVGRAAKLAFDVTKLGVAALSGAAERFKTGSKKSLAIAKAFLKKVTKRKSSPSPRPPLLEPDNETRRQWEFEAAVALCAGEPIPEARIPHLRTLTLDVHQHSILSQVLERRGLKNSKLRDASALSKFTALTELYLNHTRVSNVSALFGLTALETLSLYGTQVSDVSPLSGLTALKTLRLDNTKVKDASALFELSALEEVWLVGTGVPKDQVKALRERGVVVFA